MGMSIFGQVLHTEAMGLNVYLTPHEQCNSNQLFKETLPLIHEISQTVLYCVKYIKSKIAKNHHKKSLKIFCRFQVMEVSGCQ